MCAINPTHKKRFIIDCYTAFPNLTEEVFINELMNILLETEIQLNTNHPVYRFHLKESKEQAD